MQFPLASLYHETEQAGPLVSRVKTFKLSLRAQTMETGTHVEQFPSSIPKVSFLGKIKEIPLK